MLEFGVWVLGFGVWGLGFGVWGLGFGVGSCGFGVGGWGSGVGGLGLSGTTAILAGFGEDTVFLDARQYLRAGQLQAFALWGLSLGGLGCSVLPPDPANT